MTTETRNSSEVIDLLGGVATLASRLGVSKQCVANWRRRGIPSQVILQNLQIFYPYLDKLNGQGGESRELEDRTESTARKAREITTSDL